NLIKSGIQGEVIVNSDIYEKLRLLFSKYPQNMIIGGNIGNICYLLAKYKRFKINIFVPFFDEFAFSCFKEFPNVKLFYNNLIIHQPHLIFETELRRIIITPKLNEVFSHEKTQEIFEKIKLNEFDLLIFSGGHLLTDKKELFRFIDMAKKTKAKFRFCELAHFQSEELLLHFIDLSRNFTDLYGMSIEEYLQLKKIFKKIHERIRYFVHSKDNLITNVVSLKAIIQSVDKYCKNIYRKSKISIGLGDKFSAKVLTKIFD
ncbi:MAG: hypothetical protein QW076_04600, partial [Candidatus Anstonellales archaeon]